jgi:DNA-binding CsgD family transcriptional regulator
MSDQSTDEAEIIDLIHRNRIAAWTSDFATYEQCFVHAPYTTRWNATKLAGIFVWQGWDDYSARVRKQFSLGLTSKLNAYETEVVDLKLRVYGDMAWATFRQRYPAADWHHTGMSPSYEVRVFERHDGSWRVAFLGYLDGDPVPTASPLVNVGPDGTVLWQNEAATALLADDDDLVIRNGRIKARDSKNDQRLQGAIKWAAGQGSPMIPGRGGLPIVIEAGDGIPAKVWWVIADSGQILLSLAAQGNEEKQLAAAAVVFGLSPAQRQIAAQIVAGRSVAEAAGAMGITANTARTHLERIFEKTGVRTQPALVRVLLSTVVPI